MIKVDLNVPMLKGMKKAEVIMKEKQLKRLAQKMMKVDEFAYDTETNTLKVYGANPDFKLVGISISWGDFNNYYIPTGHVFDKGQLPVPLVAKYLKPAFEREDVTIVVQNAKYDLHVMERIGISIKTPHIFDTMIASWICDENAPKGLKDNSKRVLGIDQTHFGDVIATVTKEQKKAVGLKANNKATFDLVSIENGSPYALADSYYTWRLYLHFLDELEKEQMETIFYKTYPQFTKTLFNMEKRGITVDVPKLKQMGIDMQRDLDDLAYQMLEIAGVHVELGSSQQLAQLLFGYQNYKTVNPNILAVSFKFPIVSTTGTGAPQTNTSTLKFLSKQVYSNKRKQEGVQFCKLMLEYKKLAKLKSAFVDGLLEQLYDDGKAHPSFNIVGTDSGRISCSSPNLMQIPNASEDDKYQIRDVFIGEIDKNTGKRKHIISIDYSNLEVRVIAHFSQDENLINAFLENKDLHGNTAKMMFRLDCDANDVKKLHPHLRQQGKVIAFLLQYGGSAMTLYETLNGDGSLDRIAKEEGKVQGSDFYKCKNGKEVAQRLMDLYFEGFKGIARFMKSQKKLAHRQGYINTLVGRKRRLPGVYSNNFKDVSYCERLSINACIQGSGADIMINAQNRIEGTSPCYMTKYFMEEHSETFGYTENFIASDRLKELDCEMLVQVHDELLFQCPEENCEEAIAIIRDCMIYPFGEKVHLNVPLEVGAGHALSYQGGH